MNRPARTTDAALVLTLPLVGCSDTSPPDETNADPSTKSSSTPTEPSEPIDGLVDIGDGRQLYVQCTGTGSPTVIMETGDESTSDYYEPLDIAGLGSAGLTQCRARVTARARHGACAARLVDGHGGQDRQHSAVIKVKEQS